MKKLFLSFAFTIVFAAQNIFGANFDELYSRAESLARRTEGKVFRDAVAPHWLPDNKHFWYRVTTGPDAHEFVLVARCNAPLPRKKSA